MRRGPVGSWASFFSKTGAKTAKVAWFAAALATSCGSDRRQLCSGSRGEISRARAPAPRDLPRCSYFLRGDVVGWEVNAVGGGGECYVGAGVDQEGSSRFAILSFSLRRMIASLRGLAIPGRGWRDLFRGAECSRRPGLRLRRFFRGGGGGVRLVAGEGGAVGDVVKETLSAISFQ